MTSVVATVSGAVMVAVVFALAGTARRPGCRRLPATRDPASRRATPDRRRLIVALCVVVAGSAAMVTSPTLVLVLGGGAAAVAARRRRTDAARRRREVEAALVDAVELFVLCVHAGRSPTQALVDVAARAPPVLRGVLGAVELQLHRGRSLAEALTELDRLGAAIGHELARAVAAADRDGVPLAPVLDSLATAARTARRRAGDAAARQLPVRMTFPLIICTLPSVVLLAIAPAVLGALSTLRAGAP